MGGALKYRTQFSTSIEADNLDMLNELSKITRIPKSRLIDEALDDLFGKYDEVLANEQSKQIKEEIKFHQKRKQRRRMP